jgi:hypothetical protein
VRLKNENRSRFFMIFAGFVHACFQTQMLVEPEACVNFNSEQQTHLHVKKELARSTVLFLRHEPSADGNVWYLLST